MVICGMDEETYNILRAAMFGQQSLSDWTDEELAKKHEFIEWAMETNDIAREFPDLSKDDVVRMLCDVFENELAEYREEREGTEMIISHDANQAGRECSMSIDEEVKQGAIVCTKTITSTGNSLIIKITEEANILGLGRGDVVIVTIRKMEE